MANPLPDWAKPGAEVAVFRSPTFADPSAALTVIERVTATQAITADGVRWINVNSAGAAELHPSGENRYHSPQLILADDPRAVDAQILRNVREAARRTNQVLEAWSHRRRDAELVAEFTEAVAELAAAAGACAANAVQDRK